MNKILSVENIVKRIDKKEIIKGITFGINQGEILGFLGPNGAGKSTTLRMIVGLSKPTSGDIFISGYSIDKEYVKAMSKVGCIIEEPDMYEYISGFKNLEMLGSMSKDVTKKDIMEAVELVGMENRIYDKVSSYSMGMKQRLGLAQALIHKPKLLILDEPTNGLDPQGIFKFRMIIKRLSEEKNISVLLSSHLISEVQMLCNKVSIINNGLIIKNADVKEILNSSKVFWDISDLSKGRKILKNKFSINSNIFNNRLIAVVEEDKLEEINTAFINEGLKIKFIYTEKKTLEELFLELTGNQKII